VQGHGKLQKYGPLNLYQDEENPLTYYMVGPFIYRDGPNWSYAKERPLQFKLEFNTASTSCQEWMISIWWLVIELKPNFYWFVTRPFFSELHGLRRSPELHEHVGELFLLDFYWKFKWAIFLWNLKNQDPLCCVCSPLGYWLEIHCTIKLLNILQIQPRSNPGSQVREGFSSGGMYYCASESLHALKLVVVLLRG